MSANPRLGIETELPSIVHLPHCIDSNQVMENVAARVSFLKEAAYLLSVSSSAVSATLGAARNHVLETEETDHTKLSQKDWDAIRRETCGACGNLMVPGWSCRITQEPRQKEYPKPQKVQSKQSSKHVKKDIVYSCLMCNRKTIQPLPYKSASRHLKKRKRGTFRTESTAQQDQTSGGDAAKFKTANASSKQRAKIRKGGLQALLSQSKTPQSGNALDLMDFMQ
jgi:RNase P subunit RPR2